MSAQAAADYQQTPEANDPPVVVIVDDEPGILLALKAILRREYKVLATNDPAEAPDLVLANDAEVIISDQKMPGMTGVDVLRAVRKQSPRTTRIMLTGFSDREDIAASINEGEVFRFLSKPWDNDRLRAAVSDAVEAARSWSEEAARDEAIDQVDQQDGQSDKDEATVGVLILDQDEAFIEQLQTAAGSQCMFYIAESVEQAIDHLGQSPVGVIISDLGVDERNNALFLQALKRKHPEIVICAATRSVQSEQLIEMINSARIFHVLNKPVEGDFAASALNASIGFHRMLLRRSGMQKAQVVEDVDIRPDQGFKKSRIKGLLSRLWGRS